MIRARALAAVLAVAAALLAGCAQEQPVPQRVVDDGCSSVRPLADGPSTRFVATSIGERRYTLHVPRGYDGTERLPVVVMFHGLGGDADDFLRSTRMPEVADAEDVLVVVPQGTGRRAQWDFRTSSSVPGSDLAFVDLLLDDVGSLACTDAARYYATGFSNGATMTFALACDPQRRFAAFGPVSGPWAPTPCTGRPPASIIYFHGSADVVVPVLGADTFIGRLPPVRPTLLEWAERDRCTSSADARVSDNVRRTVWTGCAGDSAVESYLVRGGGHAWPGGLDPARTGGTVSRARGRVTQEISASQLMWRFFSTQRLGGQ